MTRRPNCIVVRFLKGIIGVLAKSRSSIEPIKGG